jgi:hypothetical protein
MRPGVAYGHMLKGLMTGGLLGVPPVSAPAAAALWPAVPGECTWRRLRTTSLYGGRGPISQATPAYRCPRCGSLVVGHD